MPLYEKLSNKASKSAPPPAHADATLAREWRALAAEASKVANGPVSLEVQEIQPNLPAAALLGEALRATIGHGAARPDRVLFGQVPTQLGLVRVALPLSGADALATEFAIELALEVAAPVFLERDVRGGWGHWMGAPGREEEAPTRSLIATLNDAVELGADIEWDIALRGNFTLRLPWALQLIPLGAHRSQFLMTTGKQGLFFKEHGMAAFLEKVALLTRLLAARGSDKTTGAPPYGRPLFPSFNTLLMMGL